MKIAVLGSGGWGTALALVLLENGHEVTLWSYSEKESDVLRKTAENPMLKGVKLPPALKLTYDMNCVKGCKVIVIATPSFAVRTTAHQLRELAEPDATLVVVSKGIEKDTLLCLTQVVEQEMPNHAVVALSGPSHAEEVGRHIPTGVVSASQSRAAAEFIQDVFMNERFRVYTSPDVIGVELGAALKNIIALCAGCCDGMGCGDNTKAMLMTRGLSEIARLGVAMGGRRDTFAGLAGVGDLIVTCTSMHSRNRRAGILIGKGMAPEQAVREIGAVVEGYYAASAAQTLAKKLGVEMPISQAACRVLYEGQDPHEMLNELMRRKKRHEIEENWA
jgi:glycerol-3-phosphate dehydrogenase (NAD(P)+)